MDRYVFSRFQNRPIIGLELPGEQLGYFDSLAQQDQLELLEGTVEEWENSRKNPGRLLRAWVTGDEASLLSISTSGIMEDNQLRKALLIDRNKRWMPVIMDNLASDQRPLIAVGTAHLLGNEGLIRLLQAEGYTVSRKR